MWFKFDLKNTYIYNSRKFKLTSITEFSDGVKPNWVCGIYIDTNEFNCFSIKYISI